MHHCFKESGKHTPWVVLIQLKCDDGQMHTYKSVKQLSRQHLPFFCLVSAPVSFTSYWYEWNIIYPKTFKNIIFTSTSFKLKKSGSLSYVAWSVGGGAGLALSPEPIPGLWTGFLESIHCGGIHCSALIQRERDLALPQVGMPNLVNFPRKALTSLRSG